MNIRQSSVEEFVKTVRGKQNVCCFGAGRALGQFLDEFGEYHLENDIKYIVDNSVEKQGTVIRYGTKEIQVISLEIMLKEMIPGAVILITTAKHDDIIKQLALFDQLDKVDCYIYSWLRRLQAVYDREQPSIPLDCWSESEPCIPKRIHYCWFGEEKIPEQHQRWMESWKKYCPDYEIIEWNEKNYDVSKNLYMKQAYERKKWAFVVDYAKADIIAQYGGIFLDTDVELLRNIDPLLRNKAFCGFESKHYVNFGLGFGAIKGHTIIEGVRDDYEGKEFMLGDGRIDETTSPVYQTKFLTKHGLKRDGQFQILEEGITVYPERVLCPMSPYILQIPENLQEAYSIHHYAGSWL